MGSCEVGFTPKQLADAIRRRKGGEEGTFVLEKWLLAFCQPKTGSLQLRKKKGRKGALAPLPFLINFGVVLEVCVWTPSQS